MTIKFLIIEQQDEQSVVGVDKLLKHVFSVKRPQTLKFEPQLLKSILVPKTIHQENPPPPLNVGEAPEKMPSLGVPASYLLSSFLCNLGLFAGLLVGVSLMYV
jgi:hypothetical protein